jgi:CheY-like chemotaxis protein
MDGTNSDTLPRNPLVKPEVRSDCASDKLMFQRPRVLIIDDDVDQLQILSSVLKSEYLVFAASDGLDGYAVACVEQPVFIILDLMMPLVDGWTVLRKLRSNPRTRDIRILVVTALDVDVSQQQADALRVEAILTKPVNLSELRSALKRLQRNPSPPAPSQ